MIHILDESIPRLAICAQSSRARPINDTEIGNPRIIPTDARTAQSSELPAQIPPPSAAVAKAMQASFATIDEIQKLQGARNAGDR